MGRSSCTRTARTQQVGSRLAFGCRREELPVNPTGDFGSVRKAVQLKHHQVGVLKTLRSWVSLHWEQESISTVQFGKKHTCRPTVLK